MNLILFVSGHLTYKNPSAYERSCLANRPTRPYLEYAPTSTDIFCRRDDWAPETERRYGSLVVQVAAKDVRHDAALHSIYTGVPIDWDKNLKIVREVRQGVRKRFYTTGQSVKV